MCTYSASAGDIQASFERESHDISRDDFQRTIDGPFPPLHSSWENAVRRLRGVDYRGSIAAGTLSYESSMFLLPEIYQENLRGL